MKKVLLTSTALVAFAGAAAAEVTLSGSAEMGVWGRNIEVDDGENSADLTQPTQFMQSIDVRFTMSGETDNGLTFGGTVDLDDAVDTARAGNDLIDSTGFSDYSVFVSGEFGTVSMGDIDGALDWAMTDPASVGNPGSIADDETGHIGREDSYLDGAYDGQILRYDYAYEGFGFAVSLEQDDGIYEDEEDRRAYNWAIGARYSGELGAGTLSAGLGYQAADTGSITIGPDERSYALPVGDNASVWGVSAAYMMDNGFSVGAVYSDWSADDLDSGSHWAIGAGYAFDAFSIHANYGQRAFDLDSGYEVDAEGWGLAAGYDLGGGLSVLAGYGTSHIEDNEDADVDYDSYSLGLSMSF